MPLLSTLRLGRYWVKILLGSRSKNHLIKKWNVYISERVRQSQHNMRMNVSLFSFIRSALIALIFSRYTNAKREPRGRATCTRRRDVRAPHVALVSYVAQRTRCSVLYATLFDCFSIHRFSLTGQAWTLGIICGRSHWENQKRLFTYVEDHHKLCDKFLLQTRKPNMIEWRL